MRKITYDYTPPIFTFLFAMKTHRKELVYGNDILGGEIFFTA